MPSDLPSLIPWNWVASRLFLSVFMVLSWLAWVREERSGGAKRLSEWAVYSFTALDRRALHGAIGAEHAAVAGLGLESRRTARTRVEEHARVRRHDFFSGVSAMRTHNAGAKLDSVSFHFLFPGLVEDGYPARIVASINSSMFVCFSS